MKVVAVAAMRQLEKASGIPGPELMRRAGAGAAKLIREEFFRYPGRERIVIVTGRGNNAGDGIVASLQLARDRALPRPVVAAAFPPEKLTGEAGVYAPRLAEAGIEIVSSPDFRPGDLIVDALFGIGLARDIGSPYAEWVRAINAARCPVVALDLPSGLSGDAGNIYNVCVRADLTISFGLPKAGLFRGRGPALCGRLANVSLDIAEEIVEKIPAEAISFYAEDAVPLLPRLDFDAYKNTRGRLLVAAGSPRYPGAPQLTAAAALRTGAGFVRLATDADGGFPPPVVRCGTDPTAVQTALAASDAIAAGPGWGADGARTELLKCLLAAKLPTVLDADALNLLARSPGLELPPECVLTPHIGEARRLMPDLPEGRPDAARDLAAKFGCVVLVKGPRTAVAAPDGRCSVNSSGSPALGVAGSGDVLTGVIGALLAQGLSAFDAARLGVWLHGKAGEVVPMRGLRADDLPDKVREVMGKAAVLC